MNKHDAAAYVDMIVHHCNTIVVAIIGCQLYCHLLNMNSSVLPNNTMSIQSVAPAVTNEENELGVNTREDPTAFNNVTLMWYVVAGSSADNTALLLLGSTSM
jgi:hypothetical protein